MRSVTRAVALKIVLPSAVILSACGPESRALPDGGGGTPQGVDASGGECVPAAEVCNDVRDNDCDGRTDCGDADCSGVGDCPVCGQVENPESQPLALPDGIGQSTVCSTDAQCGDPLLPSCVAKECHASYNSTLNFIGFPQGATLDDVSKLLSVCVVMEHSWVRDTQIDLITPDGRVITLHKFIGRTGNQLFLGEANDYDNADVPVAGVGYEYCWKPGAAKTMLEATPQTWVDSQGASRPQLAAGDYKPVAPWASMTGTPLNGEWEMRVTDLWPADNGFMFEWSIQFDPTLVSDCSGPIIQ